WRPVRRNTWCAEARSSRVPAVISSGPAGPSPTTSMRGASGTGGSARGRGGGSGGGRMRGDGRGRRGDRRPVARQLVLRCGRDRREDGDAGPCPVLRVD